MNSLFYQLIFNVKTTRWFELLEILEMTEQVTAPIFVESTGFGRRTIMKDIKELKEYFGETIQLIGDEKGYHFLFLDPQGYYKKKQALLAEERVFLFVDQLAAGKQLENYQWGYFLDIPVGSFSRIKHRFQEILSCYDCRLVEKNNRLAGEEASIRQFFYDFYFTLPLYPAVLADHVHQMHTKKTTIQPGQWQLDATLLQQWLQITKLRVDQGYLLPEQPANEDQQAALVHALDQQVKVLLPAREKAALFLLSLDERQFMNPLVQKEFIRMFSPTITQSFPIRDTEGLAYRLFETILCLMNAFFQLPALASASETYEGSSEEELLKALIARFDVEKKQYSQTLYVTYQLEGSTALQRWIKKEVNMKLKEAGFYLVETPLFPPAGMIRHVQVNNFVSDEQPVTALATLSLPKIPSKETIQQALAIYLT